MADDDIATITRDVQQRANDYSRGGPATRRALRAPFLDDVAGFQPTQAPIGCRADTAVVVRNSRLEDAHASSVVSDSDLLAITYLATGALNTWLSPRLNRRWNAPAAGVFARVPEHPRAYAALQALALAAEAGGRRAFRAPEAPVPQLPVAGAHVDSGGKVRRSALAALDEPLLRQLAAVATGDQQVFFTSSLSRVSRDSVLLATVLEFVLAHGGTLLTTNFLLRPGEAFSRRPPLIAANTHNPLAALTDAGLSGLHAKHVRHLLAEHA